MDMHTENNYVPWTVAVGQTTGVGEGGGGVVGRERTVEERKSATVIHSA